MVGLIRRRECQRDSFAVTIDIRVSAYLRHPLRPLRGHLSPWGEACRGRNSRVLTIGLGWQEATEVKRYCLKDVCEFYAGTGFPLEYQGNTDGQYPFYKVGDISENVLANHIRLQKSRNYVDADVVAKLKGTMIPAGTVVFAKIGEALRLNRRAVTSCDCLIDNNAMGIRATSTELSPKYFFYFMKNLDMSQFASATTAPSVRKSTLENLYINLPLYEEQETIAKKLDILHNLIINRQKILALLDELVKSRFVEMFGNLSLNDKNWPIEPFTHCAKIDSNMIQDFAGYEDYPHIGIDSIEKETGRLLEYRTVREDGVISGKYLFTPNHIIYSKIRPNLNKVALPTFVGLCSADAYPILPNAEVCNRIYLAYVLRGRRFLNYILAFSSRTNMPKVNRKQVEGFELPLPPFPLQQKFAAFVHQIDAAKAAARGEIAALETLRGKMMQEFFG